MVAVKRSRFPRMLLQHTVQVAPLVGWNTWGPAVTVQCLVDEQYGQRFTQAGIIIRRTVTVFAPLETVCPVGSKVTLPDGSLGYAAVAVRKEAGRLPVPEHLEISVDTTPRPTPAPAAGETVVLLRRGKAGTDRYGNDRYVTTELSVDGVAVSRLASVEDNTAGATHVTVTGTLVFPPGTVVGARDRVRVRGLLYDVDGLGATLDDATLPGADAGVEVRIRRVTG